VEKYSPASDTWSAVAPLLNMRDTHCGRHGVGDVCARRRGGSRASRDHHRAQIRQHAGRLGGCGAHACI
jgi:hypothetical protein